MCVDGEERSRRKRALGRTYSLVSECEWEKSTSVSQQQATRDSSCKRHSNFQEQMQPQRVLCASQVSQSATRSVRFVLSPLDSRRRCRVQNGSRNGSIVSVARMRAGSRCSWSWSCVKRNCVAKALSSTCRWTCSVAGGGKRSGGTEGPACASLGEMRQVCGGAQMQRGRRRILETRFKNRASCQTGQ